MFLIIELNIVYFDNIVVGVNVDKLWCKWFVDVILMSVVDMFI